MLHLGDGATPCTGFSLLTRGTGRAAVWIPSGKEVREPLSLSGMRDVARVKSAAERKLAAVEARIGDLERVRQGLSVLVATCPGHGRTADCPILQALGGDDR